MRDVVIIGGGLSGLAAAVELEKQGVAYTLIEVKRRLGGSIHTEHRDGFALDSAPMLHTSADLPEFVHTLEPLDLADALVQQGEHVLFREGTGMLIDALAKRVTAPIMHRMAVSTLGQTDSGTFLICMENGMVLDARALIVASPARFAERMFYTLVPEISFRLLDYRYDSIARVSIGYSDAAALDIPDEPPEDYPITAVHQTRQAGRVLPGGVLIQCGVRYDPAKGVPADLVGEITALFGWPQQPQVEHVAAWPESDPLMWLDDDHPATMADIQHLLPPGVALCGSDYIPTNEPPRLDERIRQGQQAARRVLDWIKG
ncbi:MAG: FAD-dependent oxidoreductase [bacterium]|nr:FAD-dependent oxidoreductase [bacterium]